MAGKPEAFRTADGRAAARVDGIAAPVLARPDGPDFDGAVDDIHFALDKPPTIGYTGSVWQGAENRRQRGPLGRLVLRPEIGRTLVDCPAAAGRLPSRGRTAKKEFFFLREQCGNAYENKGPLWKGWAGSGNVYENKGSYVFEAGMYMKTRQLMLS